MNLAATRLRPQGFRPLSPVCWANLDGYTTMGYPIQALGFSTITEGQSL